MNVKLVVASMSILGLVSCPVFAATNTHNTTSSVETISTDTTSSPRHHKKHMMGKFHRQNAHRQAHEIQPVAHPDYKDMGMVQAPVDVACSVSESSLVLDATTQNIGRSIPNPCTPGWFNRISVGGGINVDLGKFGARNGNFMGENYQRLSLNDVYLNITANVNDWARAFASLSYNTATVNDPTVATANTHYAEYSAAYSNNVNSGSTSSFQLEQAFVTLGNFDVSPIYFQAGKQFQDFGRYEIHPITKSLTQVMSEVNATSAKLGFIASGFNGSLSVFDDPIGQAGKSAKSTNYGVSLGYDMPNDQMGVSAGVSWLHNIIGANDVAYAVNQFNSPASKTGYNKRVSGLALYADVNSGPFNVGARYTRALSKFNPQDLPLHGVTDIYQTGGAGAVGTPVLNSRGAQPSAWGLQAGFGFNYWTNLPQNLIVGFQHTTEAAGLMLPKHRILAAYNVDAWKGTKLGVEWDHDIGYNVVNGGNGKVNNLISIRAAVQFS